MKKILLIDNYDSFTFNLQHYLEAFDAQIIVWRNDQFDIEEVASFDAIVISPGPGLPKDAGIIMEVIKQYHQSKPILGICLGMQAIGEYFGAQLKNLPTVFHGVSSDINIIEMDSNLFKNLPKTIQVGRYHSWVVDYPLPENLIITSIDEDENIMSIKHEIYNIRGVQFHPESILTPNGKEMIQNWIELLN